VPVFVPLYILYTFLGTKSRSENNLYLMHICYNLYMSDEITPNTQTPQTEPQIEPISEPVQAPETQTAQIPVNEPLAEPVNAELKPVETTPEELPPSAPLPEEKPPASSEPENYEPERPKVIPVVIHSKNLARELLVKARNVILSRKIKKLDKVMNMFLTKSKITNDEVEKFMHVSDATATRYLSQLEKEGKIKQTGKTGKSVFYTKN